MSASWKLTLPCTRAEAEAIEIDLGALAALDPPPVLMTSEAVLDDPESWRLEAYFEGKPDKATIAAVRALVPSAGATKATPEKIPDADWVTLSQSGLEPVRAGRFVVHTSAHDIADAPGVRRYMIEASQAFGTGHHETTTGCLNMLDRIRRRGTRVDNLIDLGTGTGLLAFAGMHLWPRAYATATDIDPIAIDVTAENADVNGVPLGLGMGRLALAVADGTANALVQRRASYDLIIANILAGPLIDLAPDIAAIATPRGQLVLAGLLRTQAAAVARAYRRQGYRLAEQLDLGDWAILRLRKRRD
ncbi:50S ribosomal protein L11 methyltransferase [Hephaestia sp. GCM10023244]|uniref:50S ribosomal protein L11 methyltransferase n=1 Tax=unclassified Hephaestia TaxID=2631281 RepID=UPI0020770F5A|nr:50S ribosomal protein L11 methyltransferase [Hephaestia sp. MAHUQ-44]MCM8730879.1 50S ribosomal protein L11 methyltransferase [Hephaestia sp. MAHUQ-44]